MVLKDKNSKVLANKKVYIKFKGKTFAKTTNSKGIASLKITFPVKYYKVKLYFKGDVSYYSSSKSLTIRVVKTSTVLSVKSTEVVKGSYLVVYLKTKDGKALSKKKVYIKINGKTYTKTTNSNGKVSLLIKSLSIGKTYKTTLRFKGNSYYYAKTKTMDIKICKAKALSKSTNGAIWLWSSDMDNVNFADLSKNGIKNIFLFENGVSKSNFNSWLSSANSHGLRVHIWFQCFHDAKGWVNPVDSNGDYNQDYFDIKINKAVKYAKMKGISGIHLDYLRYPGDYGSTKKINAVTEFTRQIASAIKKANPNIMLSASVMPEIGKYNSKMTSNEYYYGQDIGAISKYVDVVCPMVYKGNYGKNTAWIKSTTTAFVNAVKAANGNVEIWTALQAYRSDDNPVRLSVSELILDCQAALDGGASGIGLFRLGLTNMINFS